MPAQRKGRDGPLIGYSTNVHRGETLAQVYRFLDEYTVPIRDRVYGRGARAGLELRLGIGSATELTTAESRRSFAEYLDACGLDLFSVNAFPLRDFHARRVKEKVYSPAWTERERGDWTARIARIVAEIAPAGVEPSISTLGGSYRRAEHGPATFRKMARVILRCLETFVDLAREGRPMVLAFEPEPETTFETSADVIEFFEGYLLPMAFDAWAKRGSRARIEEDLRAVFSVNIDTCHLSVLFEDPIANLRALETAGIRLGKLHVTNAVALRRPFRSPAAFEDLRAMHEPRYFHQFAGAGAEGRVIWRDLDLDRLPRTLDPARHPPVTELRSHFHVPLYLKRHRRLHTTHEDTAAAVRHVLRRRTTDHLVLETYTWPILAGGGAETDDVRSKLISGIAREYRWLLELLQPTRQR